MSIYLGIDTSNYTTSIALVEDAKVVKNEKIILNVKEGERGLRQSDAVFAHTVNLPRVVKALGELGEISGIGYSAAPRDEKDSYMPCFLVGEAFAESMGSLCGIKTYRFSHQAGHVMAALYSSDSTELINERFIAFHVSGGTTDMLLCERDEEKILRITKIGGTLDLNAGQAVDRVGVMMGLKFPCGAALEKLALGTDKAGMKPTLSVKGLEFNLSGLENKAKEYYEKEKDKGLVARYVFDFIAQSIIKALHNACSKFGELPVVFAGGVMSNTIIRGQIEKEFADVRFASPEFSCDNGAGVALLCKISAEKGV